MNILDFIVKIQNTFVRINKIEANQTLIINKLDKLMDVAYRKNNEDLGDLVLKEQQVEEILGVSSRWLRQLRSNGEIEFHQLSDKKIIYRQSSINEYLERKKVEKLNKKY